MTPILQKIIRGLLLVLAVSWIILPSLAAEELPDSLIIWGPALGMIDDHAFVRIHSLVPLSVELSVIGYPAIRGAAEANQGLELPLPDDLKGQFTYRINLEDDDNRRLELGPYLARLPGEPGRDLVLAIYGDTRNESPVHYEIVEQILKHDPDLVLNTGDLVQHGESLSDWQEFRRFSDPLLARRVMLPCLGNHEDHSQYYYDFFHLPGNERWYQWTWGPMRLIALDSDIKEEIEEEIPDLQTPWLSDILSKPEPPGTFTIVLFHHPLFTSGNYKPWEFGVNNWLPIIITNPVDIVFNGHNHMYERAEYQGIPFLTAAGGGAHLYKPKEPLPETIVVESVHHFILMTFHDTILTGSAIRHDGEIFDTWEYPIR